MCIFVFCFLVCFLKRPAEGISREAFATHYRFRSFSDNQDRSPGEKELRNARLFGSRDCARSACISLHGIFTCHPTYNVWYVNFGMSIPSPWSFLETSQCTGLGPLARVGHGSNVLCPAMERVIGVGWPMWLTSQRQNASWDLRCWKITNILLSTLTFNVNLKMNQTFKHCDHGEVRLAINTLGIPLPVVLSPHHHNLAKHRKVRVLGPDVDTTKAPTQKHHHTTKIDFSSWAGCYRQPKSTRITTKNRLQFLGRMLQNIEKYEN